MNYRKTCILLAIFLSSITLSAQPKDGWLKRNWNNMIARYNIYFNADQKLNAALSDLYKVHKDDFEEILNVYPYGDENSARSMRAPMDEAMKKASKVINTKPKSKWVDDSWFLIGQTYFFIDDYYAAVEIFQFLYSRFNDPEIRMKAQLWIMKSYIQQEKYNDAEAILSLIREKQPPSREIEGSIHLVAGDLYVKQEKYNLAIQELEKGLLLTKDRILRYRVHFILGQLYLKTAQYSKAGTHFEKVIKMNAPYEFAFQANLGMAKATAESGGKGIKTTKKYLKRMLDDDKNIEYYDQIYYQLALLEFSEGNERLGLEYMLKSSANAKSNPTQQTKTYLFLADYYFNSRDYSKSQSYYDSAVAVLPQDYPEYEKITALHSVLSKLIEHIRTVHDQDSLLNLSAIPREELDRKIDQLIQEEIKKKEEEALQAEMAKENANVNASRAPMPGSPGTSSGNWYFYDPAAVSRGANDFMRIWGKRNYGDYWRFANKIVTEQTDIAVKNEPSENPITYNADSDPDQIKALQDIAPDRLKYYKDIPFSTTAKLVSNKKIQIALLEMGKIYYTDLHEYGKCIQSLDAFLSRFPQSINRPEGLFYMAKAYLALGDSAKYDEYALKIANEHPQSPYNKVLNSKEVVESGEDREVLDLYEKMYNHYLIENYDSMRLIRDYVITNHPANSIQAKFDYLYALMIGKTEGRDAYIKELEAVRDNYPGTDISSIAAYTITVLTTDQTEEGLDMSLYSDSLEGTHFYIITATVEDAKKVEQDLVEYNQRFFPKENFQVKSILFGDKVMFIIKSFSDKSDAEKYHREMKANFTFLNNMGLKDISLYAITEDNFKTLVQSKEESLYLFFFNKYYPFEL